MTRALGTVWVLILDFLAALEELRAAWTSVHDCFLQSGRWNEIFVGAVEVHCLVWDCPT